MHINPIDNTPMKSEFKLGQIRNFPAPTPKMRCYTEGYFMEKSPLAKDYIAPDKSNFLIRFFKQMYKTIVEIFEAME